MRAEISWLDWEHVDQNLLEFTSAFGQLIAEHWDLGEGGYQIGNFPALWSEWNGRYRDTVRDYWCRMGNTAPSRRGFTNLLECQLAASGPVSASPSPTTPGTYPCQRNVGTAPVVIGLEYTPYGYTSIIVAGLFVLSRLPRTSGEAHNPRG